MTSESIYSELVAYMVTNFSSDYRSSWYVGITSDIDTRLFGAHRVNRLSKGWVWRQATDINHARRAEASLINRGHDGGGSGGDHTTTYVYAFRKEPGTVR
jgi:hypothetical protein